MLHHPFLVRFWVSGKFCEMPSLMGVWPGAILNNVETPGLEENEQIQDSSRENNVKRIQTKRIKKLVKLLNLKQSHDSKKKKKCYPEKGYQVLPRVGRLGYVSHLSTCFSFLYSLHQLTAAHLIFQCGPSLFTGSSHWGHQGKGRTWCHRNCWFTNTELQERFPDP